MSTGSGQQLHAPVAGPQSVLTLGLPSHRRAYGGYEDSPPEQSVENTRADCTSLTLAAVRTCCQLEWVLPC